MRYLLICFLSFIFSCATINSYQPPPAVVSSVVKLVGLMRNASGTGFVVLGASGKKYIATNAHICAIGPLYAESAGKYYQTSLVGATPEWDLCILTISDNDLAPLPLGFVHKGPMTTIGYPLGYGPKIEPAYLFSIQKNVDEACLDVNTCGVFLGAVFPGNSGSPMLDAQGSVTCVLFGGAPDNKSGICSPVDVLVAALETI